MLHKIQMSSLLASLSAAVLAIACSSGSSGGGSTAGCLKDTDCTGSRVCQSGSCVDPSGTGGSSGNGGSSGSSGSAGSGACALPGDACSSNGQCCTSGAGVNTEGQLCISDDHACHAACTSNSECKSGCCATVVGTSLGVCAAASNCGSGGSAGSGGCAATTGSSCVKNGDCCQTDTVHAPYGETCLSDDYLCHAYCTASSQCSSSCCIQLKSGAYGACGTYQSGYTCL